jgi:Uma2 family endonuclease
MAGSISSLMTVEDFLRLPKDDGPVYHELHHGQLVEVTRPKLKHHLLQHHLLRLLGSAAGSAGHVGVELPFRAIPENDLRCADVGYVSASRLAETDVDDNLSGAPGCQEFWVIDDKRKQIKVSTPDGVTRTCRSGATIPLRLFNSSITVDKICQ